MVDIPKSRINDPNSKTFGDMVKHTLLLRPCKILAVSTPLIMNNNGFLKKFKVPPLYTAFLVVGLAIHSQTIVKLTELL